MYYNGYNGYNGYNMYQNYPQYYTNGNYGFGPAIILVLFILLVIIFGSSLWNNNCNTCNPCNTCRN
jgi:uncharacterized protein (TIGR01732 family)